MTDQKTVCPSGGCDASASAGGSRREFLGAATAAMAAALTGCGTLSKEEFLQHNFKELSKDEVLSVIDRLEKEYKAKYGKEVKVANTPPIPGVIFGYALDLSRCIGCRRCVYACVKENNQSRDPQIQWIRVLQMDKEEGVNLAARRPLLQPRGGARGRPLLHAGPVPAVQEPALREGLPGQAPPGGRRTASWWWTTTGASAAATAWPPAPTARATSTGANRTCPRTRSTPRRTTWGTGRAPKGVVEKCTFCIQRTRNGQYPACVEICPTGARKFGNLLDKDSEIRYILENKRVFKFKEDLNTQPNFFYFYGV